MKAHEIEQGCLYRGNAGQIREVVSLQHGQHVPEVTYRQISLGSHCGSGCIPVGSTKSVRLKMFAYWAEQEVTEAAKVEQAWAVCSQKEAS
jgi:hypothetical protein